MPLGETAIVGAVCGLGGCFTGATGVASCNGVVKCIDRRLASTIVTVTPLVLKGVSVQVEEVALRPGRHFSVSIKGFRVANPEGFKSPFLVVVNHCSVTVNLQALVCSVIRGLGKPEDIHITNTTVQGASLTYEKTLHTSNVAEMLAILAKDEKEEEEESAGVKGCVVAGAKGVADSSVSHAGTDLARAPVKAPDLPAVGNLHDSLRSTTAVVGVTELRGDPTSKTPKKPSRFSCFSGLGASKKANKVKNTKYSPNVHIHKVDISKLEVVPLAPGNLPSSFALPVPVPPIYIEDLDPKIEGSKNITQVIHGLMAQVTSRTMEALTAFSGVGNTFLDGAGGVVGKVVDTKVHAEAVTDLCFTISDILCCNGKDTRDAVVTSTI